MFIKGKINFGDVEQKLPDPSCLFVALEDVSMMDVPSIVISSQRFNLTNFYTALPFIYNLKSKKPKELQRRYRMTATLYVGYCPEKRLSIRKGDYFSDTIHIVDLTSNANEYSADIKLLCYGKKLLS